MINSDKIIGIMGGTFNPIHKGHTGIARCAYEQSDIDEILFMPSGTPAYKDNSPIVSATDRCNMVKLAIKPFDHFLRLKLTVPVIPTQPIHLHRYMIHIRKYIL